MKKEAKNKEKIIALFEIVLAISLSITAAYLINESYKNPVLVNYPSLSKSDTIIAYVLAFIGKIIFGEKGIVSALDSNDLSNGSYTCLISNTGSICQEFPASECNSNCKSPCIPTERENTAECKLGTCYDITEGTCATGSPKKECEAENGKWLNDPYGNVPQCQKGCCFLGDQTMFTTQKQCSSKSSLLGLPINFVSEINTELGCALSVKNETEGACVFQQDFQNTCKFATKKDCNTLGGTFNEGDLCSNTELNTTCKPEQTTGCVNGKDEIYWFDSCGNIENIYAGSSQAQKQQSWNNGKILAKSGSCSLGDSGNQFANQGTCGNCDRLQGSVCGTKTTTQKLADQNQNVVCKKLTCVDENGNARQNGESWCKYDSSIGVDKLGHVKTNAITNDLLRSVDTPGSQDFREVCTDGNITTEPCADYRNEICIQSNSETTSGIPFSSAACRLNLWQECINYNTELKSSSNPSGITPEERDNDCTKNSDCFIKTVNVDNQGFTFNVCAPKYPEGFNLNSNSSSSSAQSICSLATQKCTEVWVKDMGGSWGCVSNCNCHTTKFSEQMNDLCISLGDCGTKANYVGDLTYNSKIFKSGSTKNLGKDVTLTGKGWFPTSYINGLIAYAFYKNSPNKFIDGGNLSAFYGSLGIPSNLGNAQNPSTGNLGSMISTLAGMGGLLLAHLAPIGGTIAVSTTTTTIPIPGSLTLQTENIPVITDTAVANPGLAGAGGALAGAAVGFAAVSMMIQFSGIGPALGEDGSYALMAAGAAAGGIIGGAMAVAGIGASSGVGATVGAGLGSVGIGSFGAVGAEGASFGAISSAGVSTSSSAASSLLAAGPFLAVAFWLIIAIVAFVVIEAVLGAGQIKKVTYTFQCQPWQPPTGGTKCSQCGKNGLPCSAYSCESLGQTCQFINEGTDQAGCVNINPNDVTAPIISPLSAILINGTSYSNISDDGFVINSDESDGCFESYQSLLFGIQTDEPSYCKFDIAHTSDFDSMVYDLGSSNLFSWNHTQFFQIPSIDSLAPGYEPNRTADFNLYIRCQDKTGNANEKEYDINFCIKPGVDVTPPIVTGFEPLSPWVSYNATSMNVSVFTNKPADCKWNKDDTSYNYMGNSFVCSDNVANGDSPGLFGWECDTNVPIYSNQSTFYVRCLDQPWLAGINDSQRNAMTESYNFTLMQTTAPLTIDSIYPNNITIYSGVAPVTVNLEAKTSGGVDGTSDCSYSITAPYFLLGGDEFVPPGVNDHIVALQLYAGNHTVNVKCTDAAGNTAENTSQFNVIIDNIPPLITRVYNSNGNLNVITNENSTCSFVNSIARNDSLCNFDFENGTMMDGSYVVHTTGFDLDQIYYIKCNDTFGNINSGCGITVKGTDLAINGQQTNNSMV